MKTLTKFLPLFLFGLLLLFGCAPQTRVNLIYKPSGAKVSPCQKSLAIVSFTDQRANQPVGETSKGIPIRANDSVANWVSRAFYDDLQRSGCRVEYHDTGSRFDTDLTLTGAIKELKVVQMSHTEYDGRLRLDVVVHSNENQVFKKEYVSALAKKTMPSSDVPQEVLTELLQGLIKEALYDLGVQLK